jgi:transposase
MPPLSPVHSLHQASRLYLYVRCVDMRRSFDGLHALVQSEFHRDVHNGDMLLFVNKKRDRIKILWWDSDGLAIFMKRLEAGTYQLPAIAPDQVSLVMDRTQLELPESLAVCPLHGAREVMGYDVVERLIRISTS